MKFKFNCSEYNDNGEPIPGTGHGDIPHCYVELDAYLDRDGEDIFISFNQAGEFYFTNEQKRYHQEYWSQDAIINLVKRASQNGNNLDIVRCCDGNCENEVTVELVSE